MPLPALFKPRRLWLPTAWGWAGLAAVLVGAGWAVARGLPTALSPTAPAPGARVLVIEGWLTPPELAQALALVRRGGYARVVTSGGPITGWPDRFADYASRAADHLRQQGLPAGVTLAAYAAPATAQDRTYASALWVREGLRRDGVQAPALDIFTSGVHARRTWTIYRMAFAQEAKVGIVAARPSEYDAEAWWRSSAAAKAVMGEALSVAWTACCFWPAAPGSHEGRWAVPPR